MYKSCCVCAKLIRGRIDKKFCSNSCRIYYHNQANRERKSRVRHINMILERNRKILEQLHDANRLLVKRSELLWKGFDFSYFTSMEAEGDSPVFYCYEFGYQSIDDAFRLCSRPMAFTPKAEV